MVKEMRRLEALGKTRKQIAAELDVDPAAVTRHLGVKEDYPRASSFAL
jgi:DNA-binding MarR family transcriptional regulator